MILKVLAYLVLCGVGLGTLMMLRQWLPRLRRNKPLAIVVTLALLGLGLLIVFKSGSSPPRLE